MHTHLNKSSIDSHPRRDVQSWDRRQGAVLFMVIAFMVLAGMLAMTAVHRMMSAKRWFDLEYRKTQQELIVEGAFERAVAHLQQDPAFTGDEWRIDLSRDGNRSHHRPLLVRSSIESRSAAAIDESSDSPRWERVRITTVDVNLGDRELQVIEWKRNSP